MSVSPVKDPELIKPSATDRIRILAVRGLKIRDISSLLHIYPLIVMQVFNDSGVVSSKTADSSVD
jgi:hypothetical protein